jgi:hypothetical protein
MDGSQLETAVRGEEEKTVFLSNENLIYYYYTHQKNV